jgi:outer membrane protein OmpA-like peptidoglycan-associated protein
MPTAGDALTALLQGRVDGAILWEPYRSQAIKKGFKEIASSKGTRIIEEVMAASSNALSSKRAKLSAFLGAWFQLQALLEKNPAMAFKLIARKTSRAPSDLSTAFEGLALITLQENQALEPEKLVEKMKVLQRYWIIEGEPNAVLNTDFDRAVSLDTVKGLRIEESAPLFGETPMPIAASSPAEETPTPEETPSETPSKTPAASPTPKTSPGLPGDTSVKFLPGSFELDTKAVEKVRGWIAYMKEHGETKAVLHGWADIEETRTWSPARISESRARRVREEMTKRGIDESRITIKAEGLSKDPLGSAGNRRVDIEITPGG